MRNSDTQRGSAGPSGWCFNSKLYSWLTLFLLAAFSGSLGCGGGAAQKQNSSFFTSGSKEADQRASQTMAKAEELSGSGEGAGEPGVKKAKPANSGQPSLTAGGTNTAAQATAKLALYDRLGGLPGISNIVNDVMPRWLQDPRVNWDRKGVKSAGLFHRAPSVTWDATPQNVAVLQRHFVEFLALATGGPAHYTGKEIKPTHAGMQISNPEFDAAVGDLKASLDRLKVPNTEQKELLAIIESTRPEIVEQR